jgi:prepilin-type processing-associated H-X9-DG protein
MAPIRKTIPPRGDCGFTIIEAIVIAIVVLAVIVFLVPALLRHRVNSARLPCISNLKRIAVAELTWRHEGEKANVHWRTPLAEGGTVGHTQANQAWFQWAWLSNSLGSPKILVCPADTTAKPASDWTAAPTGGFLNPNFQDAALSYFLNMSAQDIDHRPSSTLELASGTMLAGDHNIRVDGPTQACRQHTNLSYVCVGPGRPFRWVPPLHQGGGNVAMWDGSVLCLASPALMDLMTNSSSLNGSSSHLLVPNRLAPK